ncbi:MAG: ABC transporter substrate-binding protein [Clostridia bacterium]|nr:ABC transporter substrate-binding protein [Clostridia bacterium]
MKKILSFALAAAVIMTAAGCGGTKTAVQTDPSKTVITIADWPSEENKNYETMQQYKADFEAENPDISIETSPYVYATDTFLPKAMSGQLPTLYKTYYTEVEKIINSGYAADITDMMKEMGMADALYDNIRDVVEKDGRIYGIPQQLYVQGLMCNIALFKEAGLENADGTIQFPTTYEELANTAKIIKDKTGKAGFAIPTTTNQGGWHFMNIAWSFGVEFMKQEEGKWKATFDTEECINALQYVKDLKWKYDVLPSNAFLAMGDLETQFSTDQLAMYFRPADSTSTLISTYGISKDNIAYARVPEGSAGRFAQMGGTVYMISNSATPEQISACGKWLDFIGQTATVDADKEERMESDCKKNSDNGYMVGIKSMPIWSTPERNATIERLSEKYCNIDRRFVEDYEKYETITITPEEPVKCQELYSILDSCIQSVLTNKDADVAQLVHQAASDFQTNYLDKIRDDEM